MVLHLLCSCAAMSLWVCLVLTETLMGWSWPGAADLELLGT